MPIPIPPPASTPTAPPATPAARPVVGSPYYVREHQGWAVGQERYRHNGALYYVGEWVIFFLMWHDVDFERGLVTRCQTCFHSGNEREDAVAEVYKQPTKQRCPDCFGTTFEGGYRARIVRPAILTDADEAEQQQKRGSAHPANLTVDTEVDFRARNGDYMIRQDNTRWRMDVPRRLTVRTGFEHPGQQPTGIHDSGISARFEEPGHVSYLLPPTPPADIASVLVQPMSTIVPADFAGFEVKRADLIPPAFLD